MSISPGILAAYGFDKKLVTINVIPTGLINNTWKITSPSHSYILQRVNHNVFTEPENIAHNIRLVADYLQKHHPDYHFVAPIASANGRDMVHDKTEGYFRLFPFVLKSHTIDVVESPQQAYEAARQFGKFTKLLEGINVANLKTTIPFFHDISLRYRQFLEAIKEGNQDKVKKCGELINQVCKHVDIVTEYDRIKNDRNFKLRVTHHDTKISNVLFDDNSHGICIIDLDTIMPGHFISDVGDMMRTYLSPVSEEETDHSKIQVRDAFYKAIVSGYSEEMGSALTPRESGYFFYAAKFLVYMQALRFLTDHLNNDRYYGAKYEGQNYARAANQMVLLQRLLEKETTLAGFSALSHV